MSRAGNDLRQLSKKLETRVGKACRQVIDKTKIEAVRMSAGPLSYPDLAEADHPYATRHGSIQFDPPEEINEHGGEWRNGAFGGEFLTAWKDRFSYSRDGFSGAVTNPSRMADWIDKGTRKMFPRHTTQVLELWMGKIAEPSVQKVIEKIA